jgi:hypothetical protein
VALIIVFCAFDSICGRSRLPLKKNPKELNQPLTLIGRPAVRLNGFVFTILHDRHAAALLRLR